MRAGIGFDIHRFEEGNSVILGNVCIPFHRKLSGHSDADVLLHAICDAMLGAAGEGDIGMHFPNTDASLKGISSIELLKRTRDIIKQKGFRISNLDSVVIAEAPRILPYRDSMISNIAVALEIDVKQVNVKATTSEGIGALGKGEGISAYAVCLLSYV
ncbi:MAG: 2-C-methyl-D-erythritol 2,4-cyclodiphosphate synthase [Nitrospirae bacterium]|nr:2-C-methyl-D-erythritol 2,4-cyclodiphosphate synthase [Nitrospirota bacterium]